MSALSLMRSWNDRTQVEMSHFLRIIRSEIMVKIANFNAINSRTFYDRCVIITVSDFLLPGWEQVALITVMHVMLRERLSRLAVLCHLVWRDDRRVPLDVMAQLVAIVQAVATTLWSEWLIPCIILVAQRCSFPIHTATYNDSIPPQSWIIGFFSV